MEKFLLQAILNYVADHVELSNQSWAVHGVDTNDFRSNDFLKLIYYTNPEWFNNLKAKLQEESNIPDEEGDNE